MKDIIIIVVIVGLIVCGSYFTHNFYNDSKNEFSERLNTMSENLKLGKLSNKEIEELEKVWLEKEKIFIIFQAHDAIDVIEDKLYECIHYYKINQKDEFDLSKEKVVGALEDLVKRECLTLVNIF